MLAKILIANNPGSRLRSSPAAEPREAAGEPQPPRSTATGDVSVERHRDDQIAAERAGEEDLLKESAPQE
jgi:hypothetical protein